GKIGSSIIGKVKWCMLLPSHAIMLTGNKLHTSCTFFIVAIDFGTAYSGYCFIVKEDTSNIRNPHWGTEYGLRFYKTPTCALFNEHEELVKFGFDAVMAYKKMSPTDASLFYFFENFKMELYNKSCLKNLQLKAKNGKYLPAMTVFSESLHYLKEHVLKMINNSSSDAVFSEDDITWVLTVPAIWRPDAKQFMRQAAKQGGLIDDINSENLVLALEPEAASLWCKQLSSSGFMVEGGTRLTEHPAMFNTKHFIFSTAGGTIDITVHEVLKNGLLKELQKASGGGWGGLSVDKNFTAFLRELFEGDVWETFEKEHPSELQKMMYNISVQKCTDKREDIFLPCVFSLGKLAEKKKDISLYFQGIDGASWSDGNIKISYKKLESFFKDSVTNVIEAIEDIMQKPEIHIDYILLVGGYASSKILRDKVTSKFSGKCRVLCPIDSQLAIAKGAILFGISETFVSYKHDWKKRRVSAGNVVYCTDIFMKLVERGQSVGQNESVEHFFKPIDGHQVQVLFSFFATEKEKAEYTDEPGVNEVGSLIVPIPSNVVGVERRLKMDFKFGLTEIKAAVTDLHTNKTQNITLNFMTD
uniref:Heat shock 70 kDa protein 12A-like n=1 Tax=Erpetoichthys calabaricus TaxID=27687 RepID=A0A8C4T814_ERPCA